MKSTLKLIRRFLGILFISSITLFILNILVFVIMTSKQAQNGYPWENAQITAQALQKVDNEYILSDELITTLETDGAWGIFIDNSTLQVVWKTANTPENVPSHYSASAIANLTRGYIDGYPTFTGESDLGLMVLGYPRDSFWKHMWPSWDYQFIAGFPKLILIVLSINILFFFVLYMLANAQLTKCIRPITNGILALGTGEPIHLKEKGMLSELATSLNKTSDILQMQTIQLRKKETARANWIAGVSHDIRTPLSMVMGYAAQLKEEEHLTKDERQKTEVIVQQSERIKNLINDLNLASKLEYNMQPIHPSKQNMVAIARQVVVDFMNMDIDHKYQIIWETDESLTVCIVQADKNLMKRAISNLIQNSMNHNEQGCNIIVRVSMEDKNCSISVADDGIGATDEQIRKLGNAPHYMICDENTTDQSHGLGLLIVKQIIAAHNGLTTIGHSPQGGFWVKLLLPIEA